MKTLLQQMVIAAIAAIVGVLVTFWVQDQSDDQSLEVQVNWVDISANMPPLDLPPFDKLLPQIEGAFQVKGLAEFLRNARFRHDFQLYTVEIKNSDLKRTKNVEVLLNDANAATLRKGRDGLPTFELAADKLRPFQVGIIDPGDTAFLTMVANRSYSPGDAVTVLHDNRKVDINYERLDQRYSFGLIPLIINYEPLSEILILIVAIIAILFIGLLIFFSIMNNKMEWRVRFLDKKQVLEMCNTLKYIKENRSDLLPDSSKLPAI